ncbi:MAG: HlyD family secretion protein [Caulobacteraceae bacterium]|nr:HlyD family secretion protein [Caulobacteraceae bacterium]
MAGRRLVPWIGGGVAALGLIVGGGLWWTDRQTFESTDNAFVEADTAQVSSLISDHVAEVRVADNQRVAVGEVLVRLDPTDFQDRLAQTRANLAAAQAAVKSVDDKASLETSMIAERAAGVASAQASARTADLDMNRYGKLAAQGWVSDQGLQSARSQAQQTAAGVDQARASLEAEQRSAAALTSARAQALAQVEASRAAVQQAQTDLERTVIRAPIDGVVGARSVRPGQFVQPGVTLLAVVPLGRAYVVANFKETQVARMRVGQTVQIHADAFRQPITGRIDSFAPATGSEFALIPVENAVGNFTKITQRVPVKIALDPGAPLVSGLRPGLSVAVKVNVTGGAGARFAEGAPEPLHVAREGGLGADR